MYVFLRQSKPRHNFFMPWRRGLVDRLRLASRGPFLTSPLAPKGKRCPQG
jgi:hypothetical protein